MNYKQTVEYLFEQLPMFTRIGAAAYKKDLTNTLKLCEALNNPQNSFKSIHIAGTNGKGSTSHMLASILQEAGYKVGLYTSPHLKDFRERIKINGREIPETEVVEFVAKHKSFFEEIKPSFFEWTVALAFNYFAQQKVDYAVIETGLGGRLDSTNIITPILSIITNIGWDHMDMLGDTLPKIAAEKAGIIKPNIPVVLGEPNHEILPVFINKTIDCRTNLTLAPLAFTTLKSEPVKNGIDITVKDKDGDVLNITCDLGGIYQKKNIITVLSAVKVLSEIGLKLSKEIILLGLSRTKQNTKLLGRWQIISDEPLAIADTGHNVNGIALVTEQLSLQNYSKLHMVIGMVQDKDISKVLALLPKKATYYFCKANLPRALNESVLQQRATEFNLFGECYSTVQAAFVAAQENATKNDLIFIGGSTFVVAEVV